MTEKSRLQQDLEAAATDRARDLVEAETSALAVGKEPFDLARLELLLGDVPGARADNADSLRSKYYLLHTDVRTLTEYATLMRALEIWK